MDDLNDIKLNCDLNTISLEIEYFEDYKIRLFDFLIYSIKKNKINLDKSMKIAEELGLVSFHITSLKNQQQFIKSLLK